MSIHTDPPPGGAGPGGDAVGEPALPLVLDPAHPAPFYQQIVDQVRRLVLDGRLAAGAPLPSVRALAAQLGTSVMTTRRAYEELERAGLILTRQGTGSFVAALDARRRRQGQEQEARAALDEAIGQAMAVGLPVERIRQLFEERLERLERRAGAAASAGSSGHAAGGPDASGADPATEGDGGA